MDTLYRKTFPQRPVEQRLDFARGDKLGIFNKFTLLWSPVSRTEIVQRYCSFEQRTFGMWEFVGSLLERGSVSLIPDLFYKHAQSEPRLEYELTEGWYYDAYRPASRDLSATLGHPVQTS